MVRRSNFYEEIIATIFAIVVLIAFFPIFKDMIASTNILLRFSVILYFLGTFLIIWGLIQKIIKQSK